MNRAFHSGLTSCIFLKFLHNFTKSWGYYKVFLEGIFIARDTDETTLFFMFFFDAVIWNDGSEWNTLFSYGKITTSQKYPCFRVFIF